MRSRSPPGTGGTKPPSQRVRASSSWSRAQAAAVGSPGQLQIALVRPAPPQGVAAADVGQRASPASLGAAARPCEASAMERSRSLRAPPRASPTTCRPWGISVFQLQHRPGGSLSVTRAVCRRSTVAQPRPDPAPPPGPGSGRQLPRARPSRWRPGRASARSLAFRSAARDRARPGHRRRQVADQRGRRAPLGDRCPRTGCWRRTGRVRQIADQPVRPAGAGQAGLLAGHELQRAVGAEVQHRVRAKSSRR